MNFKISLDSHIDGQIVSIFSYEEEFQNMSDARDEAVDAISEAAGDALFYRDPEGRWLLRFEEENIEGVVHMRLVEPDGRKILHITVEEVPA